MASFFTTNLDYLLFAIGALVALSALQVLLPALHSRPRVPRAAWPIVAVLLVAGWFPVQRSGEQECAKIEQLVGAMAPTYAQEMQQLGHARVTLDTAPDDPVYLSLIAAEIRWLKANPFVRDIYTMRERADGTKVFIVDSETDYDHNGKIEGEREQRTPIGEAFTVEDHSVDRAFMGEASFNAQPVTDRWGTWVTAWEPIFDADGKTEAVLGVDFDSESWLTAINKARRGSIAQEALVLGIVAAALIAVAMLQADIARRRVIEEQLRNAQERWNLNIRQMPLAFIERNSAGEILAWNPTAERIFGHTAAEMRGKKNMPLLVPEVAREAAVSAWERLLYGNGSLHSVDENCTREGRAITCEWFHTRIIEPNGEVTAVISLAKDITERLSMQAQLQQAQKMQSIGLLAAGISHDFNNILTVIDGFTNLLLDRDDLPLDAVADLKNISASAQRAGHLTRQLLSFSRQQAMVAQPLDLNETVARSAEMLQRVIGADIELHCELMPDLPVINADASMLDQIITNLAVNARDAMPRGGSLKLATEVMTLSTDQARQHPEARPGTAVVLRVTDTGCGISADQIPRIFEPFYTTKDTGHGTGLGLAAVHGLVKQHQGWIEVETAINAGTTVRIFLPPSPDRTVARSARKPLIDMPIAPTLRARGSNTVLLVEDESLVRRLARVALERAGFRVIEAEDGRRAEELWKEHRGHIRLLLTDMVMPNGVTGYELARRCLAEEPDLRVVYASGYSVETTAPGFCETAGQIFLPKPYLPQELLSTVYRCLGTTGGKLEQQTRPAV